MDHSGKKTKNSIKNVKNGFSSYTFIAFIKFKISNEQVAMNNNLFIVD